MHIASGHWVVKDYEGFQMNDFDGLTQLLASENKFIGCSFLSRIALLTQIS